ncbi:glycosyltransferase family 10 domain-containing protein [Persicirhabdus sediminis]|uniref:Glycosyltransferase family 10 (Fucosyltransferase) C-term n=1 Tax=Persicirhabdus sediminis TaxID=454144 RepID=A0A8J7MCE3_9BACT|nr:glycosyltransferase family 10 [Persicirhabdus sediminis]MBK1790523.1 hypothetical protein [Persicirhabdus sediminis]
MSIKVDLADFWHESTRSEKEKNRLYLYLKSLVDIELSDEPDVLIYSCFGRTHRMFKGPKIYFTGENDRPDFRNCDFALTFDADSQNNFRLPLYRIYDFFDSFVSDRQERIALHTGEEKFCSFVASNGSPELHRNKFLDILSSKKEVSSGGRFRNNVGGPVDDKIEFLASHRFNISFENESNLGYTTEKLGEALASGTVPIYWGNEEVIHEFNPQAFINAHNFSSLEELAEFVMKVDGDEELYQSYLSAEPIVGGWAAIEERDGQLRARLNDFFTHLPNDPVGCSLRNKLRRIPKLLEQVILK